MNMFTYSRFTSKMEQNITLYAYVKTILKPTKFYSLQNSRILFTALQSPCSIKQDLKGCILLGLQMGNIF